MRNTNALKGALHRATETAPAAAAPADAPPTTSSHAAAPKAAQSSRLGTKAITVHFPEQVRRQLKSMAGEEGRPVDDMVAEALNLLFAKYRKAEIAPRKHVS